MASQKIGKNVEIQMSGDKLTITVDVSKRMGPSKSGKTTVVATTEGNITLPCGVTLGLNAYVKE